MRLGPHRLLLSLQSTSKQTPIAMHASTATALSDILWHDRLSRAIDQTAVVAAASFLNFTLLGSLLPFRRRRSAAYSEYDPSNQSTWESPSKARMCVAILSRNQRSCEMTIVVPAEILQNHAMSLEST